MSKSILLQAQFTGYRPKKDKSASLTFSSDLEVSSEQIKQFHELLDQRGIIYFSTKGELTQEEVDELDKVDIELEGKSKSQRLRSVLFILWKQEGEQGDFKDFYSERMEKLIQMIKDRLDG